MRIASRFYAAPHTIWERCVLPNDSVCYLIKGDPNRRLVIDRMMALSQRSTAFWKKLHSLPVPPQRRHEMRLLQAFFEPTDGLLHIAQKPPGGYDVRAYAQDDWVFIEIPTFSTVEDGSDGVNTSEEKRRETLFNIFLHELAHIAGHWEHGQSHDKTIAWFQNVDQNIPP